MFSDSLNRTVLAQASLVPYRIGIAAPSTYSELARRGMRDLEISPLACEGTIYGNVATNIAFRAWHDATHIRHGLGFTLADELRVAAIQVSQVSCPFDRALVWCDVAGQALYFARHGAFPRDQRAFVAHYLRNGSIDHVC